MQFHTVETLQPNTVLCGLHGTLSTTRGLSDDPPQTRKGNQVHGLGTIHG